MGNSSSAHIAGDTRTFRWSIPKTDEIRVQQDDEHHFLASLAGRLGLKEVDFYLFTVVNTAARTSSAATIPNP